MKKSIIAGILILLYISNVKAQEFYTLEQIVHEGEVGVSAGAAHYFGDLNPKLRLNQPKIAFGAFLRKQYGEYIAVRISGHFCQLGYSDIYNSYNTFMHTRNLSFNTNIYELSVQGDFNFFKFVPGDNYNNFTPYLTFGIGGFSYDPYAYYQGTKVYLRPLGTEGQGSSEYPDRKPYGSLALCFPVGVGVKYNLDHRMNIGFEIVYRFTNTDYIDDVSKTYAGPAAFPLLPNGKESLAGIMQDRSYVYGTPIGIAGRQRGYSNQNDTYVMAEIMFSFNLSSYKCPNGKP